MVKTTGKVRYLYTHLHGWANNRFANAGNTQSLIVAQDCNAQH